MSDTPRHDRLPPARSLLGDLKGVKKLLPSFFGKPVKKAVHRSSVHKRRKRRKVRVKMVRQSVAAPVAQKSVVPSAPKIAPKPIADTIPEVVQSAAVPESKAVLKGPNIVAPTSAPQPVTKKADVIDEGESWMARTMKKEIHLTSAAPGAWTLFKRLLPFGGKQQSDPFLAHARPQDTVAPVRPEGAPSGQEEITDAEVQNDPFLRKVQSSPSEASAPRGPFGAGGAGAIDSKDIASQKDVEELKKQQELSQKREKAMQEELKRQKQELQQRKATDKTAPEAGTLKADDKEAKGKITSVEQKKPEEQAKPEPVVVKKKMASNKPGGLASFLAALNHIGMGKERMLFVQNLGTMLGAGLSLIDSLHTLQREVRGKGMKKLLQQMIDAVETGFPLWRAMEQQAFFSPHAIALVRIGEEAGNLAENVQYLALQEEKDHALRGKVKMAMIYPTIVMVLMFIIVVGLGMFVLPQLIGVLTSLDVPLPFTTRMIILFTTMFTTYGHIFIPSCIAAFVTFMLLSKFTRFRVVTQWMIFRVPGIGQLAREATIARFGVILGGLLKAGVPVVEAMQSLVTVTPIWTYRRLYQRMLDHITLGDSFAKSFSLIKHSEKLLPPSVQQLVITGERSGALADITLKVADIYDKKASDTAQKLPVILEPILLLFIGGLVGTIAFSIIVPIYSIVGNVGGQ